MSTLDPLEQDIDKVIRTRWTRNRKLAILLFLGVPLLVLCMVKPALAAALAATSTLLAFGINVGSDKS